MATQTKQNEKELEKEVKEDEPEEKQIRRIAERGEMPTDKSELIQYLSERIKQAEDALGDTEQLLETEVKERQKLAKSLQQRNKQLNKLYEVDQKALPEKIKQKLNDILSETVTQKIESEQRLQEQKSKNYEYEQMKWEDNNNKQKLSQQQNKEKQLAQDLSILEDENLKTEEQIKEFEKELSEVTEKKENLENKYLQMRVALERMNDIKGVLNRFFGNEDLWDQKMELKEQKIQRLPQPAKQMAPPSREKGKLTNSRLKPINKPLRNDDEDFWRADFKSKY